MSYAICKTCGLNFSYYPSNSQGKYCSQKCSFLSPEWRKKQSVSKLGRIASEETKKKMSITRKGRKHSPEHTRKRILSATATKKLQRIERIKNLTGTMVDYSDLKQVRVSPEYRRWRKIILERDGHKCVLCSSDKNLEIDHIIPFASLFEESKVLNNPKSIFDISNGRTLCKSCHKKTPTYNTRSYDQIEFKMITELRKRWKQLGSNGDFEQFYRTKMEKMIEIVKGKLDD